MMYTVHSLYLGLLGRLQAVTYPASSPIQILMNASLEIIHVMRMLSVLTPSGVICVDADWDSQEMD